MFVAASAFSNLDCGRLFEELRVAFKDYVKGD
jgi:hypothetical protein